MEQQNQQNKKTGPSFIPRNPLSMIWLIIKIIIWAIVAFIGGVIIKTILNS